MDLPHLYASDKDCKNYKNYYLIHCNKVIIKRIFKYAILWTMYNSIHGRYNFNENNFCSVKNIGKYAITFFLSIQIRKMEALKT